MVLCLRDVFNVVKETLNIIMKFIYDKKRNVTVTEKKYLLKRKLYHFIQV